jgi:protocatechuate 3,4-dioxygenase beta subunit
MSARLAPTSGPDPLEELSCRELLAIIDKEVQTLPEKQRLPLILCCLEGLSLEEAAGRLGWKPTTVKAGLQRGRAQLSDRLIRRGLTLSAALAAVEAARGPASSAVVARLATAAVRGALVSTIGQTTSAEGISAGAAALARAVLNSMALTRLTIVAGLLLPLCLLAVGLVARGRDLPPSTDPSPSTPSPLPVRTVVIDDKPVEVADDADVPIEVKGRVLDPTGKPYAGANLYVGYTISGYDYSSPQPAMPLRTKSAADGHFQFTFARSELDARMLDVSSPAVIAVASGYGPEWSRIAGPGQAGMLTLKLVEDLPINGRVLDPKGKPVAGAKIRVLNIMRETEDVARFLGGVSSAATLRTWRGAFPERPREVTADADGRFRLTGLGRDRIVTLDQDYLGLPNPIHAVARLTGSAPKSDIYGATFDFVVGSDSHLVRGVCRDETTGRPVPGVRMNVRNARAKPQFTDANGLFELRGRSDGVSSIVAEPTGGEPYFAASALAPATAGSEPITLDFDLVRGIPLVGKVQCSPGMKRPSAGEVEYYPLRTNRHAWKIQTTDAIPASSGLIQPDGSFQLVVLPGPGVVLVAASPRRSFTPAALVDDRELSAFFESRQGWPSPKNYNAISLINPKEDAEQWTLDVEVMKGIRLRGQVTDPNGQPLASARVMGLTALSRSHEYLEGPSFEITQMRPHEVRQVAFVHDEKKLGRILTVHAGQTGPLDVRLEPWGSIKGRLVDKNGQPVANGFIELLIENVGLERGLSTDGKDRFQGPLVPRARYSFGRVPRQGGLTSHATYLGEVTVEPGQEKDVGDVSYDNPRPPIN